MKRGRPKPRKTTRRHLTPKQRLFTAAFAQSLNALQAAIAAGYSRKSAGRIGHELLKQTPKVAQAIEAQQEARLAKFDVTADKVIRELAYVGFSRLSRLFDEKGQLKHPSQWTDEEDAAVAGSEVIIKNAAAGDGHTDTIHKIKLWDKLKALEILAKHLRIIEPEGPQILVVDKLLAILDAGRLRNAARSLEAQIPHGDAS